MNEEEILALLKDEFNLTYQHIKIIRYLLYKKSAQAKEISQQTYIPLGRIYEYLNTLLNIKLIERTDHSNPITYKITNFEDSVLQFINVKYAELMKKENLLVSKLSKPDALPIRAITGGERNVELARLYKNSRVMRSRHGLTPSPILYPDDPQKYVKWRDCLRKTARTITPASTKSMLLRQKIVQEYLSNGYKDYRMITYHTLKLLIDCGLSNFGLDETILWLKELLNKLKTTQLQIRVFSRYPARLPVIMVMSDDVIIMSNEENFADSNSIKITNKAFCQIFSDIFDEEFGKGKNLIELLPELIKDPTKIKKLA